MRGRVKALAIEARRSPGLALIAAGLFLAIAALPIVFDSALYDDFTLPKQALLLVAAALVLIGLAIDGELLPRHRILRILVLAWLGWLAVSLPAGIDPRGSLLGYYQYRQGFLTQASYVVLLLGAISLARRGKAEWLPWAGCVGLAGVAAYAAVQALGQDPVNWWIDTSARAIGTIGNANELAAYAVIAFAFSAGAAGLRGRKATLALAVVAATLTFVVVESESRSGLIALCLAFLAFPVAALVQRQAPGAVARQLATILVGAVLGFVLSLAAGGASGTASRVQTGIAQSDTGNSTRVEMWKGTVSTISESPFWGFGPDGLYLAFPQYRPRDLHGAFDSYDMTVQSSHNLLLDTAASTGLVGLAALLGLLTCIGYLTLRTDMRREARSAPYLWAGLLAYAALTLVNPVSLAAHAAFFVLVGTLAGRAEAALPAPTISRRRTMASLRLALVAPTAGAMVAMGVLLPIADARADSGWAAFARGDFGPAARHYRDAGSLMPFERSYLRREAAAWLAAGALSDPDSLKRAEAAYQRFDDRFGFAAGEAIGLATARIGLRQPPAEILPLIDQAQNLNPYGVFVDRYTTRLRRAATSGGTLHFATNDRWVIVEVSEVANR